VGALVVGGECRLGSSWGLAAEGEVVYENLSGTAKTLDYALGSRTLTERDADYSNTFTRFSAVLRWYLWGVE